MNCYDAPVQLALYENDLDAFIPEIWAQETLEILRENMVVAGLVHRDFQASVANYGDIVHTQRPAEFKGFRRTDSTTVTSQNATGADVQVPLNQWYNQTFTIRPAEMSKSYKALVDLYLRPAMLQVARMIDRAVLGRAAHAFLGGPTDRAGRLGELTYSNVYGYVVELDQILNQNKAPQDGRSLVIAPSAKAQMLQSDKFVQANERGDGGETMRSASIGEILGFQTYMAQNVNSMSVGADIELLAVNSDAQAAEYAGAIDIVITGNDGEFLTIAGNDQPTYMTDASTGAVILNEALKYGIAATAVAVRYKACAANATYSAGYSEAVVLKSHTASKNLQVGQLVAFDADGSNRHTYTVIEVTATTSTTTSVLLDRPLEKIVSENDKAFPGPYGSINLALHRNALALVTRPLVAVNGAGMMTAVADAYGLGVRVSMQDVINVGRVVAVDLLAGVAVLDTNLCVPLLG